MSFLFNTNDFTGQSNPNIQVPYDLDYSRNLATNQTKKESAMRKLFNSIFKRKGNNRNSYKSRNGRTRVGNFLQSLIGDSQTDFKQTIEGYIPAVQTEVKLSNQLLIVIGAIIFFLFGKKLFK
jgi:hypothetical protein